MPEEPEEGICSSNLELQMVYEPPYGCWELISGPLQEQQVLFTTEPSFQPCLLFYVGAGIRLESSCLCGKHVI